MGAAQTDKGSALGKGGLITVAILGSLLVVASVWSLARVLNKSAPHDSAVPANDVVAMNAALIQEELERQHDLAEQRPAPVIPAPAVPLVVAPTNQNNAEVVLQRVKANVNQKIIERMKQYVKDNPALDTRDIEKQIKKREAQGAPIQ